MLLCQILHDHQGLHCHPRLIAHRGDRRQYREDAAVLVLQHPLDRVAVDLAAGQTCDCIGGGILGGRKDLRDRRADEFVSAVSSHDAQRLVRDMNAKLGEVDDQLPQRPALEHAPVQAEALLTACLVGRVETACQAGARAGARSGYLPPAGRQTHSAASSWPLLFASLLRVPSCSRSGRVEGRTVLVRSSLAGVASRSPRICIG